MSDPRPSMCDGKYSCECVDFEGKRYDSPEAVIRALTAQRDRYRREAANWKVAAQIARSALDALEVTRGALDDARDVRARMRKRGLA